uniref:Uncharacterized protein n=1 Tax=Arundo donax TaxID=35708 RepID=A0A0A8YQV2_ARUDO
MAIWKGQEPVMDSEAPDSTWKCLRPLVPAHISSRLHCSS